MDRIRVSMDHIHATREHMNVSMDRIHATRIRSHSIPRDARTLVGHVHAFCEFVRALSSQLKTAVCVLHLRKRPT